GTATAADEQATAVAARAVKAARTDQDIAQVVPALQKLVATLMKEANSEPPQPVPSGPCLTGAPPKLIEIHLATQLLVAYENGCPVLATLVTTGRPALPTGRGTFHIFY